MKIDKEKTLKLLAPDLLREGEEKKISSLLKEEFFLLPSPNIFSWFLHRKILKTPMSHGLWGIRRIRKLRERIKKETGRGGETQPLFFLRVDDFPFKIPEEKNSLEIFSRFLEITEKYNLPFLLGLTPFYHREGEEPEEIFSPGELEIMKILSQKKIEFALHGFTHQERENLPRKYGPSELVGMEEKDLEEKVEKSLKVLGKLNIKPFIFIPPWDTFTQKNFTLLKRYFKIITGGPKSMFTFKPFLSPSILEETIYFPSYEPFYGKVEKMLPFVERVLGWRERVFVPLALHWAREGEDKFKSLCRMMELIKGRVNIWRGLYWKNQTP